MQEDLRVKRTRRLLCNALFDLMQENDFDKISVNDICDRAMVHRATFYNHFDDKKDLLNFALDELQEEMFESSIDNVSYSTPKEMYMSLLKKVLIFLEKNKAKFRLVIKHNSGKIISLISDTMRRSITYFIAKNKYAEKPLVPLDIIIDFFMGGITFIGLNFISEDKYKIDEYMQFFNILINDKQFLEKK